MATLKDLLDSGMSRDEINALLSQGTVGTDGFQAQGITGGEPYMPPPQAAPLPQNYIQNERTGRVIDMGQSQPAGPAMDYSSPIEIGGYGKGYRLKGDGTRAVLADGRIVDLGRDTQEERKRRLADAEIAKREAEVRKMNAPENTPEQYAEIERQKALGKMRGEMEGMGGGNGSGQPPAGGTGALAGVSDNIKNQVVALAEGRMAFPSGFALKSPYWQKMLQLVSEYDPNFDAINYNARAKTRADFTSGKSAENIKSLNTAIGHLSTITEKFNELENSSFPSWNTMANWTGSKAGNEKIQSAVGGFDTAKLAVSGEMAKVFRSVGMSQQEIEHWMDRLSSSQSPADFKSTMKTATDLMGGRLDAIGDQYTKGMGKTTQGLDLLSPDAKKQFQKIQGGGKPSGGTSTSVTLPNGQVKVFPSGAAAQAFRMETGLQ